MDKIPLNFSLLANPVNWLVVALMVMLAGLMVHLIFSPALETADN